MKDNDNGMTEDLKKTLLADASFRNKRAMDFALEEDDYKDEFTVSITHSTIELRRVSYKIDSKYFIEFMNPGYYAFGHQHIEACLCEKGYVHSKICLDPDQEDLFYRNIKNAIIKYGELYDEVSDAIEKSLKELNKKYQCGISLPYERY